MFAKLSLRNSHVLLFATDEVGRELAGGAGGVFVDTEGRGRGDPRRATGRRDCAPGCGSNQAVRVGK